MVATMRTFAEACGPAGEMLHLGATTQDILDTGLALQTRDACRLVRHDLEALEQIMLDLAERHKRTVMMGRIDRSGTPAPLPLE